MKLVERLAEGKVGNNPILGIFNLVSSFFQQTSVQKPSPKREIGRNSVRDKIRAFDPEPRQKVWKPPVQKKIWKPPGQRNSLRPESSSKAVTKEFHVARVDSEEEKKSEEISHPEKVGVEDDDDDTASVKSLRDLWEQKLSRGSEPRRPNFVIEMDNKKVMWEERFGHQPRQGNFEQEDDDAEEEGLRRLWMLRQRRDSHCAA